MMNAPMNKARAPKAFRRRLPVCSEAYRFVDVDSVSSVNPGPSAACTAERIHLLGLADQAGPGPADVQRRSLLPRGGRHLDVPQETMALPIPARPIRVFLLIAGRKEQVKAKRVVDATKKLRDLLGLLDELQSV